MKLTMRRGISRSRLTRWLSLALMVTPALAQSPQPGVTGSDYSRAESFLGYATAPLVTHTVETPTWLPDDTLWYRTMTTAGPAFVVFDPAHGTRKPWPCADAKACTPLPKDDPAESVSPDRRRAVFIREHNLWLRELGSGAETALTTDGVQDFGYATDNPGWEHSDHPIVTWSPDSKRIATYQQDQRRVGDMYLVDTQLGHPHLEAWKYAMAGDATVATIERVVIDVEARRVIRLNVPPDPHRSSNCYDVQCGDGRFADVQWSSDASQLAFVSTSRDHKRAQLRIADARTGAVRDVLEESSPTFYESDISSTSHGAVNWRFLPASNQIVWFSQRSDWAHLYLYDLRTGRLQHALTHGDWNVVEILKVDDQAHTLYFLGVGHEPGRDPYFVHLYRVGLDGRGLKLLTPEDANHEISFSTSGRYILDSYSRPDVPPVTVVRDLEGRQLSVVERTDISALTRNGWKPPIPFTVKARDGTTDLYGLMFQPTRFDPDRRYPLVDWIYPGPQIGSVGSRSFAASRGDRQSLAELGFIVIALDGMGTPFRSKRFHDVPYDDMRDATLPDQVAAITQLARLHPWIDLDHVGIYGHSGGGYAAAAALFGYPDFFKVGIAESGNHDQRAYTDDWGDKFTSTLTNQDTESLVKNLKGHLLLSHGTMDENVPPYLTLLLADALIKANKDFDLVMLPNQHHPYRDQAGIYMTRRRWDYFVRYLRGTEPPHEYAFHVPVPPAPGDDE